MSFEIFLTKNAADADYSRNPKTFLRYQRVIICHKSKERQHKNKQKKDRRTDNTKTNRRRTEGQTTQKQTEEG